MKRILSLVLMTVIAAFVTIGCGGGGGGSNTPHTSRNRR